MMKRNDGFTLVELMLSIAIASLITMAALSTMLLGLRINLQTSTNAKQQNATNMLMQVVQNISEEPNISVNEEEENKVSIRSGEKIIIEWNENTKIISLGGSDTPYMEHVVDFAADINNSGLLTLTIEVGKDEENISKYSASAYCRLYTPPSDNTETGGGTQ